jgi:hypothetical protein
MLESQIDIHHVGFVVDHLRLCCLLTHYVQVSWTLTHFLIGLFLAIICLFPWGGGVLCLIFILGIYLQVLLFMIIHVLLIVLGSSIVHMINYLSQFTKDL